MIGLFAIAALAGDDVAEEVIVWGDRFLRWERRWYVQTEVRPPKRQVLYGADNDELALAAYQVRAVLACDKDWPLGEQRWEVGCDVEDVSIVGMPITTGPHDDRVLAAADATLTGARLQLQVTAEGGVPDVDLEGLDERNDRARARAEQLRQILSRAILPFHLAIPLPVHDDMRWYENDSRLMSMPSGLGSGGGITLAHFLNELDPTWLVVQSIGEATIAPVVGVEAMGPGEWDTIDVINLPVDHYALEMHGVALVERSTGIVAERVWTVSGGLTASSPGAISGTPYFHAGRLRMLGQRERPVVGATYVAARTGSDDGRPAWAPLPE